MCCLSEGFHIQYAEIYSPFFFHLSPSGQWANLRLDEVYFLNSSL